MDELSRIDGVGGVSAFGSGEYSMRVWLDPEKMRVRGVSPADVMAAIESQNMEVSAGSVGAPPTADGQQFEFTLTSQGRLNEASEFGNIIIRSGDAGALLRLKDIATVEMGSQSYSMISNGSYSPRAVSRAVNASIRLASPVRSEWQSRCAGL